MPSYFNSGEAVRVFFTKETKTAEQKKMYNKLLRIWSRAVRVGGTKGGFYYQRSCSTLKGKAILIFEPQGGVDNGIFQEISKIGETLEGKFVCTKNGYIELHVQKESNESTRLKYSRSIRKIIASISGIMSGGSDDRVSIITPKVKAQRIKEKQLQKKREQEEKAAIKRKKKEEAEEKKRQAEQRKKAAAKLREENKQKRLERAAKKAAQKQSKNKIKTKKKPVKKKIKTKETPTELENQKKSTEEDFENKNPRKQRRSDKKKTQKANKQAKIKTRKKKKQPSPAKKKSSTESNSKKQKKKTKERKQGKKE